MRQRWHIVVEINFYCASKNIVALERSKKLDEKKAAKNVDSGHTGRKKPIHDQINTDKWELNGVL